MFIIANTENYENDTSRLIYAIKSDGTNFFSDNTDSYITLNISVASNNEYPMISSIIINEKEYIVSLSHKSDFEIYDFENKISSNLNLFFVTQVKAAISKNTFISLNYYKNSNYILHAFVHRKAQDKYFILQKLYYTQFQLTSNTLSTLVNNKIELTYSQYTSLSCFEIDIYSECLYVNLEGLYSIYIFELDDFNYTYSTTIESSPINYEELFSKGIYYKNMIGAFIYYLTNNTSPVLSFQKLIIESSNSYYSLENYLGPIYINSNKYFNLNYYYIYNDIIKLNENSIIYLSSENKGDFIMIILIKLLNDDDNVILNYYKIELTYYNIKIYKDITLFELKGFVGIAMTHYNNSISDKTFSSYFIIGISNIENVTIPITVNVFDEEKVYEFKIENITINIDNNIFGYIPVGIRIISSLDELNLGFFLFSNNLKKNINQNEAIGLNDILNFKVVNDLGVKKGEHLLEFEGIVSEPDYLEFIGLPNSFEYYKQKENLESYYEQDLFYGKKSYIIFYVENCYKTCKTCSYYGGYTNHYCKTCSDDYPYFSNITNLTSNTVSNCVKECPENYTNDLNNICIPITVIKTTYPKIAISSEILTINIINTNEKYEMNGIIIDNFEYISNDIKNICEHHIIIKNYILNYSLYGYEIGNNFEEYHLENNLMYINFYDIKKEILKKYNLDNNTNIYALILDSKNKYINSSTNDLSFKLFFENGTELNISDMKNFQITVSMFMTNIELLNYDYAVLFSMQGYDIYNSKSVFYNDICTSAYINKNDITIKDRNNEIYPKNVALDKTNCIYKNADLSIKRLNYNCTFNAESYNNEIRTDNDNDIQDNNFIKYFLDLINYKILICQNLFLKKENYMSNYGFIFCIIDFILAFIFLILFFISDLQRMRINLFKEIPTKLRLYQIFKNQKNKMKKEKSKTNEIFILKRNIKKKCTNEKIKEMYEFKNEKGNKKYKKNEKSNPIKKKQNNNKNINNDSLINNKNIKNSSYNNIIIYNTNFINIKGPQINNQSKNHDKKNNLFNLNKKKKLTKNLTLSSKIKLKNNIIPNNKEKKLKNDELDELPFTKAVKLDKRNFLKLFIYKLFEKIEIIDIIFFKRIKYILVSKYIIFLLK